MIQNEKSIDKQVFYFCEAERFGTPVTENSVKECPY